MNSNKLTKPAKINVIQEKEPPSRFKILVVGDAAVGKSSIIDRYLEGKFDEKYTPTIAVDYRHKSQQVNKDLTFHINFWDFSGHPEFSEVRNEFYREGSLLLLVYDITLKKTLDGLDMWIREANEYGAEAIPVAVIANKRDLDSKRVVSENEGFNWAKQRQYTYYEVSAASGLNVEETFSDIFKRLKNQK